jgi:hypothetical protein
MFRGMRIVLVAVALAPVFAGCATEPGGTDLAGGWTTRDTFEVRYRDTSGVMQVFRYANHYPVTVTAVDDSTFVYQVLGGTQTVFDSTEGLPAARSVNDAVELDGFIRVRGDTAYVDFMGRLPLRVDATGRLGGHRLLPLAECLATIFIPVQQPPPPSCFEAHHWSR